MELIELLDTTKIAKRRLCILSYKSKDSLYIYQSKAQFEYHKLENNFKIGLDNILRFLMLSFKAVNVYDNYFVLDQLKKAGINKYRFVESLELTNRKSYNNKSVHDGSMNNKIRHEIAKIMNKVFDYVNE